MTSRVRQRPAQPHLTGGVDADERWAAAACAANPQQWDLETHTTTPVGHQLRESPAARRRRIITAQEACRSCPALDLCRDRDITGVSGVVAGRVVVNGVPGSGPRTAPATTAEQRHAHAAWKRGLRDDETTAGERDYQAAIKRHRRHKEPA